MAEKRRILFLGGRAGFEGGIERYMFGTARLLREHGYEVSGAFDSPGREADRFLGGFDRIMSRSEAADRAAEFELAALHKAGSAAGLRLLARAFGRRLVFWAHDHDVYCPRRYYYTPFGRRNCARACSRFRCAGCALLASPRNWQGGGIAGQLGFLLRDAPRRLDILRETGTVVISDFMRNNLLRNGFREENIHLLSPFIRVEPEARRPEPAPELRLLFLGQLLRGKGCDLFLEMLRALGGPFRAVIAGDGNDRAGLEAMSRAFGFGERVRFLGWCGRPEELFAEADAAVFPFRWQEPFGLCGLEAAAHGVPVVAFDLGGVSKSPAIFDIDKLTHFNALYLRAMTPEQFLAVAEPYIKQGCKTCDPAMIAPLLQARCEKLTEIPEKVDFFDQLPDYSIDLFTNKKSKCSPDVAKDMLSSAITVLGAVHTWNDWNIKEVLSGLAEGLDVKTATLMWPVRIAAAGKAVTPGGAVEICRILGKEETIRRLKLGLEKLNG